MKLKSGVLLHAAVMILFQIVHFSIASLAFFFLVGNNHSIPVIAMSSILLSYVIFCFNNILELVFVKPIRIHYVRLALLDIWGMVLYTAAVVMKDKLILSGGDRVQIGDVGMLSEAMCPNCSVNILGKLFLAGVFAFVIELGTLVCLWRPWKHLTTSKEKNTSKELTEKSKTKQIKDVKETRGEVQDVNKDNVKDEGKETNENDEKKNDEDEKKDNERVLEDKEPENAEKKIVEEKE